MPEPERDFYVGYRAQTSPRIAKWIRRPVIGLALGSIVLALALVAAQRPFAEATFEWGRVEPFSGVVYEDPYPQLAIDSAPPTPAGLAGRLVHLVGEGKHGAAALVAGLDGRRVRLEGTLIYRRDQTMIEVAAGSVETMAGNASGTERPAERSLGTWTLRGKILDSKCYLGVMKPGAGKPHRACAARCISGGVPPMFVARDEKGLVNYLFLLDTAGDPVNSRVLDYVAEPLEITGEVVEAGEQLILKADPRTYVRRDS